MKVSRNKPAQFAAGTEAVAVIAELLREPYAREQHLGELNLEALGRLLEEAAEDLERADLAAEMRDVAESYARCKDAYCRLLLAVEAQGAWPMPEEPLMALLSPGGSQDDGDGLTLPVIRVGISDSEAEKNDDDGEEVTQIRELLPIATPRPEPEGPAPITLDSTPIRLELETRQPAKSPPVPVTPSLEKTTAATPDLGIIPSILPDPDEGETEEAGEIAEPPVMKPAPPLAPRNEELRLLDERTSVNTATPFVPPATAPPVTPPVTVPPLRQPSQSAKAKSVATPPPTPVAPPPPPSPAAPAPTPPPTYTPAAAVPIGRPTPASAPATILGEKKRELLELAERLRAMRGNATFDVPPRHVNRLIAQSLCFAVEVEGTERLRKGIERFWSEREEAIRSVLADGTGRFELQPTLREALDQMAKQSAWMPDKRFPQAAVLHSLRFLLASADPASFSPTLVDMGVLTLLFGQERQLGRVTLTNRMQLGGITATERNELAQRFLRMQRLRTQALTAATFWDGNDESLRLDVEKESTAVLGILAKTTISEGKG